MILILASFTDSRKLGFAAFFMFIDSYDMSLTMLTGILSDESMTRVKHGDSTIYIT